MNTLRGEYFCFIFSLVFLCSKSELQKKPLPLDRTPDLPRYVVFPGLDADEEEVAEWNFGFASPFNVFFGPKPYILGWMGEAPFGPVGEEGEEDVDIEGEEGYEEEEQEEEVEGEEGEEEELEPDYDYEKA